ncbi:hypothetical protein [Melittangium boletus]|uniref:hypothetical protein n=1 Tax=Melittangium boletus TaxID=83453 RepID=UPI003DA44B9F
MPQASLAAFSHFLGHFRWAFMPLGLLALIAVGVHAATDTLDDRLLLLVDAADARFDAFVGRHPLTEPLVDLLSLERRATLARLLALVWELAADLVLALPALGYQEEDTTPPGAWRALGRRCLRAPTTLRWSRPLATAFVVVAGACAVARLVQGTVFLSWSALFGERVAAGLSQAIALGALAGLLGRLGARAVLLNLQAADAESQEQGRGFVKAVGHGLAGSVLVLPLAIAAALDASPLLSFVR